MAITKPPKQPATTADAFIGAAPDAGKPVKQGKQQISLTIAPTLLEQLDRWAELRGQSRAGAINLAIAQLLEVDRD